MKQVTGNLIDLAEQGVFDVIVHGCNCFHAMGRGIAGEIHRRYPLAYEADVNYTVKGDIGKLGTYTHCHVWPLNKTINHHFTIVNAYTQYKYGADKNVQYAEYSAIRSVFKNIKAFFTGKRIGIPKIGAGLANGDWEIISAIIDEEMVGEDITLVVLE